MNPSDDPASNDRRSGTVELIERIESFTALYFDRVQPWVWALLGLAPSTASAAVSGIIPVPIWIVPVTALAVILFIVSSNRRHLARVQDIQRRRAEEVVRREQNYVRDSTIRLSDFAVDGWVRDRVFHNCTIVGPAVVETIGFGDHRDCVYEDWLDECYWILKNSSGRHKPGAIGLENCSFWKCRFRNIGFVETEESLALAKAKIVVVTPAIPASPTPGVVEDASPVGGR